MKKLILLLSLLALVGCAPPDFAFNDVVPNCATPAHVSIERDSEPGCWLVTSDDKDHSLTTEEPANVCDNARNYCLVVVPYEKFWVSGMGRYNMKPKAVDCSYVCPGTY